ncbi:autotransporter-associated beta strand repeat-containing protein, partial [Ochrobactrum sp. GPK 3]
MTVSRKYVLESGSAALDTAGHAVILSNNIAGAGGLTKKGAGTLVLTGSNSFTGQSTVEAGTLKIGNGALQGSLNSNVAINSGAALEFNRLNREVYSGQLSGTGDLVISSPGAFDIKLGSDSSAFTGKTTVKGTLAVDGKLGSSDVFVGQAGDLSGNGSIAGNVDIQSGGRLLAGDGSPLTIGGNLSFASDSAFNVALGTPSDVAVVKVGGNVILDGTLNISNKGGLGQGVYRLIDYSGQITDNGMDIGAVPPNVDAAHFGIQTAVNGQVNLISDVNDTNSYWDGGDVANHHDGRIDGGDGIWTTQGGTNWTDPTGTINEAYTNHNFAIFQAKGGTVTIDNTGEAVVANGMQFASDGYKIVGGDLTLETTGHTRSIVRVGDGTLAGVNMTAQIDSKIQSTGGLEKTDLGTLILTADNNYDGGTVIDAGILQLGNGGTTGSITGNIVIGPNDADYTALVINRSNEITLNQTISGSGQLIHMGPGTTILTGEDTYSGGTIVEHGTLQLGDGGTNGSMVGDVALNNPDARFVINLAKDTAFDGVISGPGSFTQAGSGTTSLSNEQAYTGETIISGGKLALVGDGSIESSERLVNNAGFDISGVNDDSSTIQSLKGNENGIITLGDKTLIIKDAKDKTDPNKEDVYAGVIEGNGRVEIAGGKQRFTGENTYTGGTRIDESGTLIIGDGGTKG